MSRSWIFAMGFLGLIGSANFLSCGSKADYADSIEQRKRLAGELRDAKLYSAAIEEYGKILDYPSLDVKTQANINYLIGKIYFENLSDYEDAAAYYIRARSLDPEGSFAGEATKNLVTSLERMGRMVDASRELKAAVDIDYSPKDDQDVVVAKIGDEPVWLSAVEKEMQSLPPNVQRDLMAPEKKAEFVRQFVGMELMYRAAIREGFDDDPEIAEQIQQYHRDLLINKYVIDKVMPSVKIDSMDVRNFYQANKDGRYRGSPYDSVKAQVFLDYQGQKTQQAFSDYVAKLAEAEKVQFIEENIK
ncbi:MAG: hypothetical protein AB1483_12950 [Candidatus Zixiibacteriota bacterium]